MTLNLKRSPQEKGKKSSKTEFSLDKRKQDKTRQTLGSPPSEADLPKNLFHDDIDEDDIEFEEVIPRKRKISSKTGRANWTAEETNMLHDTFSYFINLPSPQKSLPGKRLVMEYMTSKGVIKSYCQTRMKLMNMQRLKQDKAHKEMNFK